MAYKGTETVKKEYPRIGGFRVRLLETADGVKLDVREHVDGGAPGTFEGFTRKGIRLDGEGMQSLFRALSDIFAGPVRMVCQNTVTAAPAPAPAVKASPALPSVQRRAAGPVVPSTIKARAAELAPAVTPGPKCSPAVEALKARMRDGATISLADIMAASAAPAAPAAPAPVKAAPAVRAPAPAPVPSPADVAAMLDRTTAKGQRVGEYMLSDIMEETLKHV